MKAWFKKNSFFIVLIFIFYQSDCQSVNATKTQDQDDPATIFLNPPESAKPGVLWMWMGSGISKEGITKDLEALKQEGFNRTTMFSLADITTPWRMK